MPRLVKLHNSFLTLLSGWRQLWIFTPPGALFRHLTEDWRGRMAYRKNDKENRGRGRPAGKQMSESSPNPHGEGKVLQMPINTDQRNAAGGRNIPQVPNTVGGKLNPSVAHEFRNNVLSNEEAEEAKNKQSHPARKQKNVT